MGGAQTEGAGLSSLSLRQVWGEWAEPWPLVPLFLEAMLAAVLLSHCFFPAIKEIVF